MKRRSWLLLVAILLGGLGYTYWKLAVPVHRVEVRSELVMLGDLDDDHEWAVGDREILEAFLLQPFAAPRALAWRIDLNRNGLLDPEDLIILRTLVDAAGDPYAAEETARDGGRRFPRPRELYRYVTIGEYRARPLWALPNPVAQESALDWLAVVRLPDGNHNYAGVLEAAIHDEAVRFDLAWRARRPGLLPIERDYAAMKLARAKTLFQDGERYELLLALMELVEDAETLTARDQPAMALQFLAFRDHLRDLLGSSLYADFQAGKQDWQAVLALVSEYLRTDLGLAHDLATLEPPRNFTDLENYLQRAEWQYYKTTTSEKDFRALIGYAQHDPRYLRAVSRTSRRLRDVTVENHNLPMVLLFREALRIKGGDKKKAVGMLDEAIRIPYAWVKSIPGDLLPASLDLALKRELQDLRDEDYSDEAMREFFRDMIGNLNGMYHVMTVNPSLLY